MKTKKDPRHQARRIATQAIFEWTFKNEGLVTEIAQNLINHRDLLSEETEDEKLTFKQDLLDTIISCVSQNHQQIDQIIRECAPEWPIDQISRIDLSIIRIAICELLYLPEVPTKVAIDEAVELAKEFGSNNSSKFVNGVLGTVVNKYLSPNPEKP